MSFRAELESVVSRVEGALACTIMGFDGIPVESHQPGGTADVDLSGVYVEYANILNQVKSVVEPLKAGAVTEMSINTEKLTTLIRLVSSDYFLALTLKPDGNYGKARYVLRITAPKVRAEL